MRHDMINRLIWLQLFLIAPATAVAGESWWLTEPIALIQTNLRESDSGLDAKALVKSVKEFPANTLLFSCGGIVAQYPTSVEYHYRSAYLPPGKDLVGDVLEEAHQAGIRMIARFDFSRTRKEVYDAHPEWFFRRKNGDPVFDDNGLYATCINGAYYNGKAIEILTEALGRYDVDGVFLNWFGNIRRDYQGRDIGACHCAVCENKFKEKFGRTIPDEPDREYDEFIFQCESDAAKLFRDMIHRSRPNALFMSYIDEFTDALVAEADLYKWRPLPQWIYVASDHVNSALNSRPDKMVFDLVMPYQEMRYRFASVAGPGLRALLYENLAHGAFPAFVVLGTMDQPDMTALKAVRPVFQFYDKHKEEYVGQKSAARVILYARRGPASNRTSGDYRGFFRLLTELHIPFKVTSNVANLTPKDDDLVVVPEGPTPDALLPYLQAGGSVLVAGTTRPSMISDKIVKLWENTTSSYMRITDHSIFPSLRDTWTIFWEGSYLELEPSPTPMTLIPPGKFGPPEKVSRLEEKTDKPGLVLKHVGNGRLAFIPWHAGDLYYRYSNDKHRMLVSDLIDDLLPRHERQLVTNAHPSVEITVMKQAKENRTVIHLVNLVGHSGTAFFVAVTMNNISVRIRGEFVRASSLDGQLVIPTKISGGYTGFIIPSLDEYYAVILSE